MNTRRDFLQRAGAGAIVYKLVGARPQLKAASKNDQIGLGFIGVGIRGTFLLQGFQAIPGVRPIIAADVYDGHHTNAKEITNRLLKKQIYQATPRLSDAFFEVFNMVTALEVCPKALFKLFRHTSPRTYAC